jgi:hypothetical protein
MSHLVCGASPLIVLAKAGWLSLLPSLFAEISAPKAVIVAEVTDGLHRMK